MESNIMEKTYSRRRRRKRTLRKKVVKLFFAAIILVTFLIAGVYLVSFLLGPPNLANEQNTLFYSTDGQVIGEEKGAENRNWVKLDEISPYIIDATLMIEDKRFYEHKGLDVKRIISATITDLKTLSFKEGASTLTQQYARNLYLSSEKTIDRKLKEAFYAIRLEMFYSKDKILEGYLNTIYYGHGAYGIEAASNYFFGKSAKSLTLAEAAMLAGIPKGPTYYSPLNDLKRATDRQQHILNVMLDNDVITENEYNEAINEKLTFTKTAERKKERIGPYFQDSVLREAASILQLSEESIRSGGYKIYTTLNSQNQQQLERNIDNTIKNDSKIEIGAIAMDPANGAIRALVGGRDYEKSTFNRAINAKRMPGSTFKPFLYYAALNNGYKANTMLMSEPTAFELENGQVYQPSNYNGYYANEPITLAQAIALSDNVYAVKTNLYLGPDTLVKTAKQFGISKKLPAVPSLALGTATVTVQDMVHGYSMLANGGKEINSHTIEKIVDRHGKILFKQQDTNKEKVLDARKTFILTQLMTGMFDEELDGYMSVTGSSIANKLTRTYAGKSGTTASDSWMIGYSPTLVTGVWVGYDNNEAIELTAEEKYAKEIWATFMEAAHKDMPEKNFSIPSGVVAIPIDPETGERATPYCDKSRVMYFEKGTEPKKFCHEHFQNEKGTPKEKKEFRKWFDLFFKEEI